MSVIDPGWEQDEAALLREGLSIPTANPRWLTFCKPFGRGRPPERPSQHWHYPLSSYVFDNLLVKQGASSEDIRQVHARLLTGHALQSNQTTFDVEPVVCWRTGSIFKPPIYSDPSTELNDFGR
jgi:hypothetical protein